MNDIERRAHFAPVFFPPTFQPPSVSYPYLPIMITLLAPSLQKRVVHIIQKRTKLPATKLIPTAHLSQDLRLDTLQVVEIIWDLEKRFHLEIPDDVPLQTIGDFIQFI